MRLSNVFPWKKICSLLCSSAFFWVTAQSVSLADNQVSSPPIAKKDLKKDRERKGNNDGEEGGDDEDMDEEEDDTPEESLNIKSQPQAQEPSFMSGDAYLETLNKAQTNGGAMNTQQVMMVSAPPAPKQDAPKEELVRSNSIDNSTDEDGRITTTYHAGFRPTHPVQPPPQYVDLGPNFHPSKPWPPKPDPDGGSGGTDVGTQTPLDPDHSDWHPPKPWPPKPDPDGGSGGTDVGTQTPLDPHHPDWHPPKPWPPKPDSDGGSGGTDVGTDP